MQSQLQPAETRTLPLWVWLLVPLVAGFVLLPMLVKGISCGHDLAFHGTNWFEAAQQWRQGIEYPRWTVSPNYSVGEPRFVFYPPASWMLGAAIGTLVGWTAAPFVFVYVVLCAAGFAMYRLARVALLPAAAMAAALLYMANPYTLFVIYTRSAYAELLAAAILPLLFAAVLRPRVHIALLAEVVAALWLTNAPAAVVGMYCLLVLSVLTAWRHRSLLNLLRTAAGVAVGIAVAAIYILPAAYERRWVQIGSVIGGDYDFHRSFLFGHMGEAMHVHILHQVSLIAVAMLAIAVAGFAGVLLQWKHWHVLQRRAFVLLGILAVIITFLLTPASAFVWSHAPQLAYLQFPWRFLMAAATAFALLPAAACSRVPRAWLLLGALACAALGVHLADKHFYSACETEDEPRRFTAYLQAGVGQEGTDEYTPAGADRDDLLQYDPDVWLYAASEAADRKPADHRALPQQVRIEQWTATRKLFSADLPGPAIAIVRTMDYPAWRIHLNGRPAQKALPATSGQIQIALPAGHSEVDLRFVHTIDQLAAALISALAVLLLGWISWRERHHHYHPSGHQSSGHRAKP